MNWNRIFLVLSGSPEDHPKLVAAAGLFVIIWFAMDLIEFVDWANSKFSGNSSVCLPIQGPLPEGAFGAQGKINPASK